MTNTRAKRDFVAMEDRRRRAAILLRRGIAEAEVARLSGVSRQSVSRWAHAVAANGTAGLRRAAKPGRKPRLNDRQLRELSSLLKTGPRACGFPCDRWTGPRVAELIERRFGVTFRRTRALELLRDLYRG